MLRNHLEKLTRPFKKKASVRKPDDQKVDESRRGFLKGITALGVLAAAPSLEGCENDPFWGFDQNINLSQVEELAQKGPVVESKFLSEDEYYDILERTWAQKNLHLDPRKIITLPQSESQSWKFIDDRDAIEAAVTEGGYTFIGVHFENGGDFPYLRFSDGEGVPYKIGLYLQNELAVNIRGQKGGEPYHRFSTRMPPLPEADSLLSFERFDNGELKTSYGFSEDVFTTLGSAISNDAKAVKLFVDEGVREITSKDQMWKYLSQHPNASLISNILKNVPREFLKIESLDDLNSIIQLLPSNDPSFFSEILNRIVLPKVDTRDSQEYKSPMQTLKDGFGDCDDWTILTGYWAKLNGFELRLLCWRDSRNGDMDHVNSILTNPKTGEQFFCENTAVLKGADADKLIAEYEANYRHKYEKEV